MFYNVQQKIDFLYKKTRKKFSGLSLIYFNLSTVIYALVVLDKFPIQQQ